ncbi:hypothetical protein [Hymenobacter coalescens]
MKFLLKPALLFALPALLLLGRPAEAQVRVQVNIGAPAWGPPVPTGAQYYYIPEIDGYYDLYSQSYLYFDPYYNDWVSAPALPAYYAGYDPRFFHPVVVQYVGRQPWGYIYDHRDYCNTLGLRPGYYRSAPGYGWRGGYGGYGRDWQYRQQPDRYDNRNGYARSNDDRDSRYDRQPSYPSRQPNRSAQNNYPDRNPSYGQGPGRSDGQYPQGGRTQQGPSNNRGPEGGRNGRVR